MAAFGELGASLEVCASLESLGWHLPTDVQAEAVGLVLGGGDVAAAAETGGGKTGAFAIPTIQAAHEVLEARPELMKGQRGGAAAAAAADQASQAPARKPERAAYVPDAWRDPLVAVHASSDDALVVASTRADKRWCGVRGGVGVKAGAQAASFSLKVLTAGLARVGWANAQSPSLELGVDRMSFGYGSTGKKSHNRQFEDYGVPYGKGDVVGVFLSAAGRISYTVNGESVGAAYDVPKALVGQALYPAVTLKGCEAELRFADAGQNPAEPSCKPLAALFGQNQTESPTAATPPPAGGGGRGGGRGGQSAPETTNPNACPILALVLSPTKDLAEQTSAVFDVIANAYAHWPGAPNPPPSGDSPLPRCATLVGGADPNKQLKVLRAGGSLFASGTPGRVLDLLEKGSLTLDKCLFLILDEADRLVDEGNLPTTEKIFARWKPRHARGDLRSRAQLLFFSATLHDPAVRSVVERWCPLATWVDLKGPGALPSTVIHRVVRVNPNPSNAKDDAELSKLLWEADDASVPTDGVHSCGVDDGAKSTASARVKVLKAKALVRLIDAFHMDRVIVFCRTNHDCTQMQEYLNALGGGTGTGGHAHQSGVRRESGKEHAYTCACVGGSLSNYERSANLEAFKSGEVRILLCTDAAARGIDVSGLPFMVNMTLPDRSEDYIHRTGRVGRAEAPGVAISLVSEVPERVWYCKKKDYKPWLRPSAQDVKQHTVWYDEPALWQDVMKRLGPDAAELAPRLTLAAAVRDGLTAVGMSAGGSLVLGKTQAAAAAEARLRARLQQLRPRVAHLAALEASAQARFFRLRRVAL